MTRTRLTIFVMLIATAALPLTAAPGRYAIRAEQVARALSTNGAQVTPDQVDLPANVVASVAEPVLKVKSIDRADERRLFARLECVSTQQCLPFIVTVHLAGPLQPTTTASGLTNARMAPAIPVVRAGSAATLLLEGTHVHIRLPVVCLESGAAGQTIRAASPDRKQFYTVQVVREGVLEGRL
jgi:hypothetical protein